jgi:SAM-dependent methyltransferase
MPALSNPGYCVICMADVTFSAQEPWLRDHYRCARCGSIPRQRAIVHVMNQLRPGWRSLAMHESSPSIGFFAQHCGAYSSSYFYEDVPVGSVKDGNRCENLEALTFPDESFDLFVTQDVLEHVFHPDRALAEIMRVLRRGGAHIFTAPKHKLVLKSYRRAALAEGRVTHLHEPVYHGNPIGDGRSLVTWDYGADFDDLLQEWSGYSTSTYVIRDRHLGIDGEYLEVFVTQKNAVNRRVAAT